jgi:hypothetical protein
MTHLSCVQSLVSNFRGRFLHTERVAQTMVRIGLRLCFAGTLLLQNLGTPPSARAQDLSGILNDPLKLGHASDNILRSVERIQLMLNQVGSLEVTTNADLKDRISQVNVVVNRVIAAVNQNVADLSQIIAQAETTLTSLEQNIYLDAQSILDRVQCVAQNIATTQVQEAVGNAVGALHRADPSIRFFGIKIIDLELNKIEITAPDKAYISVRDGYLKRLDSLGESDSAYTIISTYANIERLAVDASCAYRDPTFVALFVKQEFYYRRLAMSWANIPVKMIQK